MLEIISKKQTTILDVWFPRYSSVYTETGERVALLAKYKVEQSTPILIVEFTKAKHLKGQRYAIRRSNVMKFPLDSNGKIPCYAVPMSAFESYSIYGEMIE